MRIVYMGTPDFAVGTLEAIVKAGHEVAAVVTQPDKPAGRGKNMQVSAVKAAAQRLGLPVLQPEKVRSDAFFPELERLHPDVIVVAAFGQIIPQRILDLPPYGCLNVHASLLPAYRGAAPIQWAILNGEEKTGATIMQMNAGLDTGDILTVREVEISPEETGGSLFDRLSAVGAELLVETLELVLAGSVQPVRQPAESPTAYARMIRKTDGELDWRESAESLERRVRAMTPWPCAYTRAEDRTLKIWKAETAAGDETGQTSPGTVLSADESGIMVQTGSGALRITELQREGKKRMPAADYLRGAAMERGTVLG